MPSEFSRIARFLAHFPAARVPLGPGDDCAVLAPPPRGEQLCVTTDAVVEGVHFTRAHFRPADVGHKALAVNVSDLAAMGARPSWFVCALALPPDFDDRALDGLARGMAALARTCGITLVGGNMTAARELSVTLTAAGHVPRGGALTRGGGRAGDLLYVSGTLGDAALGLRLLQAGAAGAAGGAAGEGGTAAHRRAALARQRRPTPRVGLGRLARRFARAALDVSDGLAQDLGHLCRASGVGARLEADALPRSPALRALARRAPEEALRLALGGGEDYELLLAVPPARAAAFERACVRVGETVTRVGVLTPGARVALVDRHGRPLAVPEGWRHF
jgi:thiamine-monophosphate kinase